MSKEISAMYKHLSSIDDEPIHSDWDPIMMNQFSVIGTQQIANITLLIRMGYNTMNSVILNLF